MGLKYRGKIYGVNFKMKFAYLINALIKILSNYMAFLGHKNKLTF